MKTIVLEGSSEQVVEQLRHIEGRVVRALIYVDEPAGAKSQPPEDMDEWLRELDEMMKITGENTEPADVSREAMYNRDDE